MGDVAKQTKSSTFEHRVIGNVEIVPIWHRRGKRRRGESLVACQFPGRTAEARESKATRTAAPGARRQVPERLRPTDPRRPDAEGPPTAWSWCGGRPVEPARPRGPPWPDGRPSWRAGGHRACRGRESQTRRRTSSEPRGKSVGPGSSTDPGRFHLSAPLPLCRKRWGYVGCERGRFAGMGRGD